MNGYRSYICFGICILATVAFVLKWIDQHVWEAIIGVYAPLGGIFLRVGSKNDAEIAARKVISDCQPNDWGPK